MQVTGGKFKGKKLANCKSKSIRPAMGLVRKSIFDTLKNLVNGANVLDLFAGTGIVGIEAISRGAKSLVVVDSNPLSVKLMRKNLSICNIEATVIRAKLPAVLNSKTLKAYKFDLIFIDPPYGQSNLIENILEQLINNSILSKNGLIFIESEAKSDFTIPEQLEIYKEKLFGTTKLTILKK
ncbi:MAG: 16S rRNA (guanine(966)-N(2))-methyltransferase RsmD [Candidatus Melainabacteria bacterium]|nr:16S rRNA (guanine(966)-N(2))-methyltransferase RsmD [Candidatus Melainabacteria bacterium]MBI3308221.1 16S rRNA (guanine(966)-N(2))-methyltransferase RsmD [Candidatus Melainabacteria bacterium]